MPKHDEIVIQIGALAPRLESLHLQFASADSSDSSDSDTSASSDEPEFKSGMIHQNDFLKVSDDFAEGLPEHFECAMCGSALGGGFMMPTYYEWPRGDTANIKELVDKRIRQGVSSNAFIGLVGGTINMPNFQESLSYCDRRCLILDRGRVLDHLCSAEKTMTVILDARRDSDSDSDSDAVDADDRYKIVNAWFTTRRMDAEALDEHLFKELKAPFLEALAAHGAAASNMRKKLTLGQLKEVCSEVKELLLGQ
jgi:hypothetical protein